MLSKICDYVIYHNPRYYCAFPAVVACGEDSALVVFRRARDPGWLLRRLPGESPKGLDSVDHLDGRSQLVATRLRLGTVAAAREAAGAMIEAEEPRALPADAESADQDASLVRLGSGRLLLAGFTWYPVPPPIGRAIRQAGGACVGSREETGSLYVFWGGYTRVSPDDGNIWSPHHYLPPLPEHRDAVPGARPFYGGAIRGRPVVGPNGRLYLAAYAPSPRHGRQVSHLWTSMDDGAHWAWRSIIAEDETGDAGFPEPALALLADGRLLACHRSTGLDDRLVTALSEDDGLHWQPWRSHDLIGHPIDPLPLPDGRLLLIYGYRHPPCGIRARLWHPDDGDAGAAAEMVVRDDSPSPDIGYPWATVLDDGSILIVYYFCDSDGVRHIAASRLAL